MDIESGFVKMDGLPFVGQSPRSNSGIEIDLDPDYLRKIPEWTKRELAIAGVASGSVTTSVIALFIAGINPFIYATAIAGILIPPYSALQEQKITDCRAMRETNDAMAEEMEILSYNNERLNAENEKLEGAVGRLQDMSDAYAICQEQESVSLKKLEQQLQQSKNTLAQMNTNLSNVVVDNIFDVMLAIDEDQDFHLSDAEIDKLLKRIEGIAGVEVNGEVLKKKIIENGRELDSVMILLKDILSVDSGASQERVIRIVQ